MMHLSNTTLCCVSCVNYAASVRALEKTLAIVSFDRAIFLTDADIQLPTVEVIKIAPLRSSSEYSRFMLHKLVEFISTDFLIVIQWDGYVINPYAWREEFKQFDYIGAPWDWAPANKDVGNGGFSFRSRKLLNALRDSRALSEKAEDEAICREFRPWLESDYGIRIADRATANLFSFERTIPSDATFGFHGLFNMATVLVEDELEGFFTSLADSVFNGPEIIELGLNYWRANKLAAAQYLFRLIVSRTPSRLDAQFLHDHVRRCIELSVSDFVKTADVLRVAMQYHQSGDVAAAKQFYLLAILLDPNHPDALNLAGLLSAQMGQAVNALPLLRKAIKIRGDVADYHADLGYALNVLGRANDAIASYEKAISLNPANSGYFFDLGTVYQSTGDIARAGENYRKALLINPDSDEVKHALANLSKK